MKFKSFVSVCVAIETMFGMDFSAGLDKNEFSKATTKIMVRDTCVSSSSLQLHLSTQQQWSNEVLLMINDVQAIKHDTYSVITSNVNVI